jgi:hypothetical protein
MQVVAAVVKAENDDGAASDEDYAGAGEDDAATATASTHKTRSRLYAPLPLKRFESNRARGVPSRFLYILDVM